MDPKTHYQKQYEALRARAAASGAAWLTQMRRSAMDDFRAAGFPTTREEAWKYTSVEPIAATPFTPAPTSGNGVSAGDLAPYLFAPRSGFRLVFVNGRYCEKLSNLEALPGGARVESLAEALRGRSELLEAHLARYAATKGRPFAALNTALLEDGALVLIPRGVVLEEPIHLVFVTSAQGEPRVSHPRVLVLAGESSRASIVESYVGFGAGAYFTNAVTEIEAADNAIVEHCKLLQEGEDASHIATLQAHLKRDSNFISHSFSLGGVLVRNHVNAVLDAEGVQGTLYGLYVIGGRQHVDNHTRIDHAKPHGSSREVYKGVLDGRSRSVFDGRVIVRPGAQKTDAKQTNRNLLLSKEALVDTNPELEIYADDVKCTHGATIGQLDEEQIFYLRSRGIGDEAARNLLVYAFASEMVEQVRSEPVRGYLERVLRARLPGAAGIEKN